MSTKRRPFYMMSSAAVIFGLVAISSVLITGEPASPTASRHHVGMVEDWSFHRLVFSDPGTYEQAIATGAYSKWLNIQYDTRFILQQTKRSSGVKPLFDARPPFGILPRGPWSFHEREARSKLKNDWTETMLAGGQVQPNMYPAKYSFSTTTASCTSDFVVYPTGVAGAAAAASIIAYNELYGVTGTSGCGTTATVPSVYWAYNTGAMVSTSPILSLDGSKVAFIQVTGTTASLVLLKWAQTPATTTGLVGNLNATNNATTPGITLTAGTFTAADVGARISDTTTGADIPAGDTISSVLSSTTALLAAPPTTATAQSLTITAEALATPGVPPAVTAANFQGCTAPCMYSVALSGPVNVTYSSPYYDFANDALYVGDNSSHLHKFTPVFNGTPTEVPEVTLNGTAYDVGPPVLDYISGCVFVGDSQGYLYSVSSGAGGSVCTGNSFALFGTSELLGGGALYGIFDGPLVDPTAGKVYAFVTDSAHIGSCAAGDNCVVQFTTQSVATPNNEEPVGTGAANRNLYAGAFDNVYYSSNGGTAGDLWVMGNTGATGGGTLYRIPIGALSAMSAPVAAITGLTYHTGSNRVWASPITEFCNNGLSACTASGTATTGGTDYLFFSVNRLQTATSNCGNASTDGCVLSYSIDTPTNPPTLAGNAQVLTLGTPGCWATGGIIVDNSVPTGTEAGASEIYLYELNGNTAGGPTQGTYTSSTGCTGHVTTATPIALQGSQASP
jgi:hypothetical protein